MINEQTTPLLPLARPNEERGFMMAEALISLGLLSVGLVAMAAVMTHGMLQLQTGANLPLAKQKAVESVFTSRDTRIITWAQVRNKADGGIFLDNQQPIRLAGNDGLVNTDDDGAIEELVLPGPDGYIGTGDDRVVPLNNFTRDVQIIDINQNLREIRVTIVYPQGDGTRTYTLSTYMSSFA